MKDPYRADTITLGIETRGALTREELYLKEMGSPTPRIDVYQNIRCVMFHSGASSNRWSLLCLDQRGPGVVEGTDWIQETAKSGVTVVGTDITVEQSVAQKQSVAQEQSVAQILSRILRVVSYLDLRRDIVDARHALLCGTGEYGMWALIAGILDERVAGIIMIDPPTAVHLPDSKALKLAELVELFLGEAARDLAILGIPGNDAEQMQTVEALQHMSRADSLRIEKESNTELIEQTILAMTGRERT